MVRHSSLLIQDENLQVLSHNITYLVLVDVKEPTQLFEKSREYRPWWYGQPFMGWVGYM